MRIVLDTNVLVSGLLYPGSKPACILDLAIDQRVTLLLDGRIFAEYVEVLERPRLRVPSEDRLRVLDTLRRQSEFVLAAPLRIAFPDPSDAPFLEVAVSGSADALVTGNLKDYPLRIHQGVRVLSPAQFLKASAG